MRHSREITRRPHRGAARRQRALRPKRGSGGADGGALSRAFQAAARAIAARFALPLTKELQRVRIFGPHEGEMLDFCQESGLFAPTQMAEIRRNVRSGESYFVPSLLAVHLSGPGTIAAGEEASHLLRHLCGGTPAARSRADLFYQCVMNEAVGYLGSKVVAPRRGTPSEEEIFETLASPAFGLSPAERDAFVLAQAHLRAERDEKAAPELGRIYHSRPAAFVGAAHLLGYALGQQIYGALEAGRFPGEGARALFYEDWAPPAAALRRYLLLRGQLC